MVGVAYFDLGTGAEILINADENFHAASTMKVPLMVEVFRQDRKGKLSLNDYIPIKNDFISIADGTRFSISAESDSEQTLYNRIGQTEVVIELVRQMIDASSNLATNLLIERVTAPSVMEYMREIGGSKHSGSAWGRRRQGLRAGDKQHRDGARPDDNSQTDRTQTGRLIEGFKRDGQDTARTEVQ